MAKCNRPEGNGLLIGKKIGSLRKHKGLTLQQVGEAAGLSVAFLSQVERERASPSVSSLASIASALEVSPSYFFPPPPSNGLVVRRYSRQPFHMDDAEVVYARLGGDFEGRAMEPLFVTYPPGYVGETFAHQGEEFVYVLEGQLLILLGETEYVLNANDSIHYSSRHMHRAENRGDLPVHAIFVNTPKLLD